MTSQNVSNYEKYHDIAKELLGSRLFDSIPLDHFRSFFPLELRSPPVISGFQIIH